jgi:hypothetical protein
MVNTSSPQPKPNNPTVAIIYGLSEGPLIGRQMRQALKAANFQVTNAQNADIIIAHSGGCFTIPKNYRASLIILVGVPFWPGKGILRSTIDSILPFKQNRQNHSIPNWLAIISWHALYSFRLIHNLKIWRDRRPGRLWRIKTRLVLVRNDYDAYCTPELSALPFQTKPVATIKLLGNHDNLWRNPKPYIDILKLYYEP